MSAGAEARGEALKAFMARRFEEAAALYAKAAEADPADVEALRGAAMALGQRGDVEGAIEWARRLVAAAPDDPLAHATLSVMLQRGGKIQEAEEAQARARVLTWKAQLKPPAG
jgi:Flp pilus assembly protein TadD